MASAPYKKGVSDQNTNRPAPNYPAYIDREHYGRGRNGK